MKILNENLDNDLTVVVFPWERFSVSPLALKSLLDNTSIKFNLIYVDGNSPLPIFNQIKKMLAPRPNTTLLRYNHYLLPIQARNIGVAQVKTKYVALVANDVFIRPGALESMLNCAVEEDADAVTPVVLIGNPETEVIHSAGGTCNLYDNNGRVWLRNFQQHEWKNLSDVAPILRREQAGLAELHCWLANTQSLRRTGNAQGDADVQTHVFSQWDFGLTHQKLGMKMYFASSAVVVYMSPFGIGAKIYDLPFFFNVWSEKLAFGALQNLARKHNISPGWPKESGLAEWLGEHRRIPLDPLINGTRSSFAKIKLRKVGTAIQKLALIPGEMTFNRLYINVINPIDRSIAKADALRLYLKPTESSSEALLDKV